MPEIRLSNEEFSVLVKAEMGIVLRLFRQAETTGEAKERLRRLVKAVARREATANV